MDCIAKMILDGELSNLCSLRHCWDLNKEEMRRCIWAVTKSQLFLCPLNRWERECRETSHQYLMVCMFSSSPDKRLRFMRPCSNDLTWEKSGKLCKF